MEKALKKLFQEKNTTVKKSTKEHFADQIGLQQLFCKSGLKFN